MAVNGIYDNGLVTPVLYDQYGNQDSTPVWTGATELGGMAQGSQMGTANPMTGTSNSSNIDWTSNYAGSVVHHNHTPAGLFAQFACTRTGNYNTTGCCIFGGGRNAPTEEPTAL